MRRILDGGPGNDTKQTANGQLNGWIIIGSGMRHESLALEVCVMLCSVLVRAQGRQLMLN